MTGAEQASRSTDSMRAVRCAHLPPFDELCALVKHWRCRTGSRDSCSAGGDSILLHGRPGCGKSTITRAVCVQLELVVSVVSAATLQLPRRKLEQALRRPGSVLVFEQLELLAPAAAQVGSEGGGTAALLPWLQKARECGSVFVIGCCGQLAAVHPRVRRWFDDECEILPPSSSVHRQLLKALLCDRGTDSDCSLPPSETDDVVAMEQLAAQVEPLCTARSYMLADVVALIKEARLLADIDSASGPQSRASSASGLPSLADFHAAMAQRCHSGLTGLGGVIDPPAPTPAALPKAASSSEHAPAPPAAGSSSTPTHEIRWDDIGGLDEAKARIEELVVWPYSRAAELRALGVRRPAVGLLLYGPPGTGKTMLARACAHQVKASFVALELSAIVGAHVGESERTLATVFASARRAAPAILFLDELDALFVAGDAPSGNSGSGSVDRLTTTLATELDRNADDLAAQLIVTQQQKQHPASGCVQSDGLRGVFVIAATNNAAKIDPTLRSAGRLEAALSIGYPDRRARLHIATKLLSSGSLEQMVESGVTPELLADLTEPTASTLVVRA